MKSKARELVTTWNFRSFDIKVTWQDENIMLSFKRLVSWNNTKLQATTQLTINLEQLSLNLGLQRPPLTWHGHQQQQKNKKNIFEPSLAQVVKILRS